MSSVFSIFFDSTLNNWCGLAAHILLLKMRHCYCRWMLARRRRINMCCEYQISEVLVHIMYSRSFKWLNLILNIYTLLFPLSLKLLRFLHITPMAFSAFFCGHVCCLKYLNLQSHCHIEWFTIHSSLLNFSFFSIYSYKTLFSLY